MKRDKDYIRELLLKLQSSQTGWISYQLTLNADEQELKLGHHLDLLMDEGLVAPKGKGSFRLTALGHDAAEMVGESTFWSAVKEKSPREAYEIAKNMTSSLALSALSKLLGLG